MRFENFESVNQTPLGEGDEKKVFIDPNNERRVISERKLVPGMKKETPRQLKGRYYLTKIAHALLPQNIPDIYQAKESIDAQTTDRERIAHSEGHALLQEVRKSGGDEDEAGNLIREEMGAEMSEIALKLSDIGLGFNIDENAGNFSKDESGNVYYLEDFNPWQADLANPGELEALFDEETLRGAILKMPDGPAKEQCEGHLERLLVLLAEEEKQEIKEEVQWKESLRESGPEILKLEEMFTSFEQNHSVESLHAITTVEEALNSEIRKAAKEALKPILDQLSILLNETNMTSEQYIELKGKYMNLSRAVGMINSGKVNHEG